MLQQRKEVLLPDTKKLAIIIAITLYVIYLLSRIGIDEPINILPIVLSLNILLLPQAFRKIFKVNHALSQISSLLFFISIGWIAIILQVQLGWLMIFILVSVVSVLAINARSFERKPTFQWLSVTIMMLFALRLVGLIWDNNYLNPLAPESFSAASKFVHVDTLFLSALTSILETYKITALGIYGLTDFNYHYGSNVAFASLSFLCSTTTLQFYNFAYPVIFLPLFCESLLNAALGDHATRSSKHFMVLVITLFFILGGFFSHRIESWYLLPSTVNSHFISQSYGLSLILTFLAIAVYKPLLLEGKWHEKEATLLIPLIPVWFFIIGYTKLSTAVVLFGALGYCLLRTRLLFKPLVFAIVLLSAMVIYFVLKITVVVNEGTFFIQWGSYYNMFIEGNLFVYFILNYLWLILFAVLIWLSRKHRSTKPNENRLRFLALEILAVTAVIGVIPGILIHIPGGSAAYFSDIQYWFSAIAVLSIMPHFLATLTISRTWRIICLVIISALVIKDSLNKSLYNTWKRNLRIRSLLIFNDEEYLKKQMRKKYFNADLTNVLWRLEEFTEYQAKCRKLNLTLTKQLDDLPSSIKSNSLLYCEDPEQLGTFLTCTEATFYLNAMTGIAMANGLYWGKECYDIWEYGIQGFTNAPKEMTAEEALRFAQQQGFSNLIVINLKEGSYIIKKVSPASR